MFIKIFQKDEMTANELLLVHKEAAIAKSISALKHAHLAHFIVFHEMTTCNALLLVTEFYTGGNLLDLLLRQGALREHDARPLFCQLVSAIMAIHKAHLVHGNIKVLTEQVEEKIILSFVRSSRILSLTVRASYIYPTSG